MLRGSQPSGSNIVAIISSITSSAIVTISPDVPEKVSLMSCRLLLSIASTVRPHFLLGLAPVQQLIEQVSCGGLSRLPHRVNSMLHQALTTMFLLPWQNVPDSNQVSKTFKASSLQDRPQASISTKLYTSVCSCTVYSKWLYFAVCQFNIQGGQNYDDSEFLSLINRWG